MLSSRDMLQIGEDITRYRNDIQQRAAIATPELAARLSRIYQANPGMNPAAVAALALSGVEEQKVFQMYAEQQRQQRQRFQVYTDSSQWDYDALRAGDAERYEQSKQGPGFNAWVHRPPAHPKTIAPAGKASPRSFWDKVSSNLGVIAPGIFPGTQGAVGEAVEAVARPVLEPVYNEVLVPLANGGQWVLDKTTPDFISDPLSDLMRGTVRYGFAAVQWTPDVIENLVFGALSNPEDAPAGLQAMIKEFGLFEGIGKYLANAQLATDWGHMTDTFLRGERVDSGTGFFVGGETRAESDRMKYAVRGSYTGGENEQTIPKSFGTFLGQVGADIGIWDRDSVAYDYASGFVDMTYELVVDPLNLVGVGLGDDMVQGLRSLNVRDASKYADFMERVADAEAAGNIALADDMMREGLQQIGINTETMTKGRVRELFTKNDPTRVAAVSLMRQEAGIIREGGKRFVMLPEFAKFLTTGRGRSSVNRLVEMTDASDVKEVFKWRIGNIAASEIAKADDAEGVIRALVKGMSNPAQDTEQLTRSMPHLGLFSIADKKLWVQRKLQPYTRLGNMMPTGSTIEYDKPNEAVRIIDSLFRVIPTNTGYRGGRYGGNARKVFVNKFIDAFAEGDVGKVKQNVTELTAFFADVLARLGYDSVTAEQLTEFVKNTDRLGTMRWMDQLQGIDSVNTAPLLVEQLLQSATIIDEQALLGVIRNSTIWKKRMRTTSEYHSEYNEYLRLDAEHRRLVDADDMKGADAIADEIAELRMRLHRADVGEGLKLPDQQLSLAMMRVNGGRTDRVLQVWKSLQLARFAYLLRTAPDDGARAYFSGAYRSFRDYLGTMLASYDGAAKRGVGRYLSPVDNERFVRSAQELNAMEARIQALSAKIAAREATGRVDEAAAMKKELRRLEDEFDVLYDQFDETAETLGEILVGKNRTDALSLIDRQRFASVADRGGSIMARKDNPDQLDNWVRGVMERVTFLSSDEPSRVIARAHLGMLADDTVFEIGGVARTLQEHIDVLGRGQIDKVLANYFHSGPGKPMWRKYARARISQGEPLDVDSLADALTWTREVMREIAYVVGELPTSQVIPQLTVNLLDEADPELLRVIATKRFRGRRTFSIQRKSANATDRAFEANQDFRAYVKQFADKPNSPRAVYASPSPGPESTKEDLNLLGFFYQVLVGIPEDKLVRDPLYRRLLWKQTATLVRLGSKDEAAKVVARARKADIDDDLLELLEANARMTLGDATAEDIAQYADVAAKEAMKDVLFDTVRRGSTADATRRIVAFGDAWYEGFSQWGRTIFRQRGKPVKSLMKGIEGGRDGTVFGPDEIYVWDSETGEYEKVPQSKPPGVFYQDSTTGQWGYNLPMSEQITSFLARSIHDVDTPGMGMFVPLENLNMLGTVSPGLGPLGAMLINPIIPDDPKWDGIVRFLNPFGAPPRPGTESAATSALTNLLPGYLQKWLPAIGQFKPPGFEGNPFRSITDLFMDLENNPWYLNFQNNTMKQLMSTGRYDSTAAGSQKLLADTQRIASLYGFLWGVAQFVGPGAPSARQLATVTDPETGYIETNMVAYEVINDVNKMSREYADAGEPPHKAMEAAFAKYGPDIFLYFVPNTNSKYPGTENSAQWWDWYRTGNSREFVDRFPTVGAFFGAGSDEYDLDVRNQLSRNGLVSPKKPDELAEEGRLRTTFMLYNVYRDKFPPEHLRTPEQKLALADYGRQLEQENEVLLNDDTSRQRRSKQLRELESMYMQYRNGDRQWADVLESDVGWAVMTYMEFRAQAQRQGMERLGLARQDSWATSNPGAVLRDGMRDVARYLSQGYEWTENGWVRTREGNPGFARLYSYVLEREMTGELDVDDVAIVEYRLRSQPELELSIGG